MKRAALWAAFVVALLIAIFTLFAAILALSEAVSGNLQPGDTLGSAIGAVVILVLLTAALVCAAWLAEHHARRIGAAAPASPPEHPAWSPVAPGADGAPEPSPSTHPGGPIEGRYEGPVRTRSPAPHEPAWARPSLHHDANRTPTAPPVRAAKPGRNLTDGNARRRHTPASHITTAVIFGLFALGCAIASVVGFHDWRQSVATQNNGIRLQAAVVATQEVSHSTRSSTYKTTNLTVQYPEPVESHTQGVIVARSDEPQLGVTTIVAAVVDRSDPTHVELQGIAGTSGSEVWVLVVLTLFFALISALAVRAYLRLGGRASKVR